jgi:predicted enzyme related to lactoylglutathione lyase
MKKGIRTIVYPARDLARAKAFFRDLLGVEPYVDDSSYVGFKLDGLDIGLDPHGHQAGLTVYYRVEDIRKTMDSLLDAGAQTMQEIRTIGAGGWIACVRDRNGNIIGLIQ